MKCLDSFDNMCRRIVIPQRFRLNQRQIIQRQIKGKFIQYKIFNVKNQKGLSLSVVFFINNPQTLPTILYLHGNGGTKLQILPLLRLDSKKYNYCSFDFSGCGKSQGQYITYGKNQVQDINTVINYLQKNYKISEFHLWGRSMGAVAAIMYAQKNETIKSMVLDSPFTKLEKVLKNVALKQSIPGFIFYIALYFIKNKVQQIVSKQIFNQNFSQIIKTYKHIPILFGYSQKDDIVHPQDVLQLYELYQGQKYRFVFNNSHSDERPEEFILEGLKLVWDKSVINKQGRSNMNVTMKPNYQRFYYHSRTRMNSKDDLNLR